MHKVKSLFNATGTYLREVVGELRKVVWPSRERTMRLTLVVVVMVLVVSGYLYLIDLPLGLGMKIIFNR
jgi:preprotein translocase subunit SecE